VNRFSGKQTPSNEDDTRSTAERRHIGRVVHDERGAASVEWRDAPDHYERPVLEVEDTAGSGRGDSKLRRGFEPTLEVRNDDTFNPYDRSPDTFGGNPATGARQGGSKRDLKKLSEWLKMMRAMEERKKNGED
jgi:hypothetical protein